MITKRCTAGWRVITGYGAGWQPPHAAQHLPAQRARAEPEGLHNGRCQEAGSGKCRKQECAGWWHVSVCRAAVWQRVPALLCKAGTRSAYTACYAACGAAVHSLACPPRRVAASPLLCVLGRHAAAVRCRV
eukprot:358321-Chlamydomonas_euryale.AAC.3